MKLNGLLALYSNCPTAPARYMVLLQTLEFAKQSKALAALLVPAVRVRLGCAAAVLLAPCAGSPAAACWAAGPAAAPATRLPRRPRAWLTLALHASI